MCGNPLVVVILGVHFVPRGSTPCGSACMCTRSGRVPPRVLPRLCVYGSLGCGLILGIRVIFQRVALGLDPLSPKIPPHCSFRSFEPPDALSVLPETSAGLRRAPLSHNAPLQPCLGRGGGWWACPCLKRQMKNFT